MEAHVHEVERYATCPLSKLEQADPDLEVRVVGMAVDVRAIRTKRGDRMAFVQLQDHQATVEVVFFSEPWSRSQRAIRSSEPVLVIGNMERRSDEVKVLARTAELLSSVMRRTTRTVELRLGVDEVSEFNVRALKSVLVQRRGDCRTRMVLTLHGEFTAGFELPGYAVEPAIELVEGVNQVFGRDDVVVMS
jgi:DNA polymerase-3 subunit alpha